jgi:hypothetical protein
LTTLIGAAALLGGVVISIPVGAKTDSDLGVVNVPQIDKQEIACG